ncbi:cytochrome c-type biogenesis protein [Limnohabitans sp. 15K]|uniref:cytochrome c-type biogenesis protein n=1 Tax=Limnohabitans sp. 15K TaxID=1100706 RepID=UPI0018EB9122
MSLLMNRFLRLFCRPSFVLAFIGPLLACSAMATEAQPTAQDPVVEARLVNISGDLRCLVCQNESLASSHAKLADDLREEVRSLIKKNQTDEEIKTFLTARYGDFVLYRPVVKPMTWALWFGPFVLLLVALAAMLVYLRQRQRQAPASAWTDEELKKAERLLKDGESA